LVGLQVVKSVEDVGRPPSVHASAVQSLNFSQWETAQLHCSHLSFPLPIAAIEMRSAWGDAGLRTSLLVFNR